jgi:DNA (cytosine-5)-methyltransferase 1
VTWIPAPTMAEVAKLEGTNGLSVISTFSGAGGSSLGYRMAGWKVLAASEFVPAARDVYRLNSPDTPINPADIRDVNGAEWLFELGVDVGDLDLLDGSPPCASFSTVGAGSKGWGDVKKYSAVEQRTDDLFYEYARLLRQMRPRRFIAENVTGLIKGEAKGYFKRIFAELQACGYRVEVKVIAAHALGVPQARERVIFQGVRNDLNPTILWPTPAATAATMRQALPHLGDHARARLARRHPPDTQHTIPYIRYHRLDGPSPTVTTVGVGPAGQGHYGWVDCDTTFPNGDYPDPDIRVGPSIAPVRVDDGTIIDSETGNDVYRIGPPVNTLHGVRRITLGEARRLCSFPDDFALTGKNGIRWERLGRAVPPLMMRAIATAVAEAACAD